MKKYFLIKFCLRDFLYFSQSHRAYVRAPYRDRFENNTVFSLKIARPTFFHLCKIIAMTCANICFLAQFPRVEKIYTQQSIFEFEKLSVSTVLQYSLVYLFLSEHTRVVKVAPRAQTFCRIVYRVTLN